MLADACESEYLAIILTKTPNINWDGIVSKLAWKVEKPI